MKPTRVLRRRRKTTETAPETEVSEESVPEPTPVERKAHVREPTIDSDALEQLLWMDEEEFARAMDGSASPRRRRFEPGDEVEGTVVGFSDADIFVDIGGKAEATLAREELTEVAVGDKVTALVLSAGHRGVRLGKRLRGSEAREHLDAALESGVPMEGRVVERNKGGFVVEMGSLRGFCPTSRIDPRPGVDLDAWVGRTLSFRVVEVKGRDIVLDRRSIAEEEAKVRAEALWRELAVGQRRSGVVETLHDFGLFVDLGGVRGLVPARELGEHPPKSGETVEVRVDRLDQARERVSLSLGASQPVTNSTDVNLGSMADAFARAKKR